MGTSLYGALAYNGLKVNEGEGRLLAVNRIFDDGNGRVDVARAERDFKRFMPEQVRTRNKVIHISLNPHPDDHLTDTELEQLAREYLDRLGYGDQPYLVFKHEDISRHHLHIVSVNVDKTAGGSTVTSSTGAASASPPSWKRSTGCTRLTAASSVPTTRSAGWTYRRATSGGRFRMS